MYIHDHITMRRVGDFIAPGSKAPSDILDLSLCQSLWTTMDFLKEPVIYNRYFVARTGVAICRERNDVNPDETPKWGALTKTPL